MLHGQSPTALHLKFAEGSAVRLRGNHFVTLADDDLTGLTKLCVSCRAGGRTAW
jgi:hypothetical protein